jgi:hypothetical protein
VTLLEEVMAEAAGVVHASANARLRECPEDAELVLKAFIADTMGRGMTLADCWMLLFSASIGRYTDTVIALAHAHGTDPATELTRAALYSAGQ